MNTDRLFKVWELAKADFIAKMGDSLMYTIPEKFVYTLTPEEREDRLKSFIIYLSSVNPDLSCFVEEQKAGFFQNLVDKNFGNIHKGCKLIKAFKHFENDPVRLRELQDKASLILMEDRIEGYLTVSVHPFDFLTLSDNNHHWTSCHSLKGDYRAGNLSYMTDASTVICYFSNNKPEKLSNCPSDFEWPSKKWRCLLFFSENRDMIFASKQYPFEHKEMLNNVLNKLLPQSGLCERKKSWSNWNNQYIKSIQVDDFTHTYGKLVPMSDGMIPLYKLFNTKGDLHYNDILWSISYEEPYYAYLLQGKTFEGENTGRLNRIYPNTQTRFNVGHPVKCLCCESNRITLSQMVYCTDCLVEQLGEQEAARRYEDLFCKCPRCGDIFFDETGFFINDEEYVCEYCATEVPRCVDCDNLYDEYGTIFYDDGECLCIWCQKDREDKLKEEESNE